jgi:hypothetical protein
MPTIYGEDFIQLYSNALVVLELSSSKWPSTGVLRDSLDDLVQQTKPRAEPIWRMQGFNPVREGQLKDVRL